MKVEDNDKREYEITIKITVCGTFDEIYDNLKEVEKEIVDEIDVVIEDYELLNQFDELEVSEISVNVERKEECE